MEGGVLSSTEAAERLRISRQTVERQRGEGKLLALHLGTKGYRYPSWQFGLPGLDQVLAALGNRDPWEQISFFLNPSAQLADSTPLQMLRQSADNVPAVSIAASVYGEQGG